MARVPRIRRTSGSELQIHTLDHHSLDHHSLKSHTLENYFGNPASEPLNVAGCGLSFYILGSDSEDSYV